jgi:SAM-dependent methyltransferase
MSDLHVAQVAALFERVASDYDQHVPFFTAFAERLVVWTDVRANERVLDVGTGRGAVAEAARSRGATVIGVDIAAEMLRHGRGPRVRADARTLPVRDGAFDVAIGAFSIHLLPDPIAGLREAARTVRFGGRVVLAHGGRFASADWDFWFATLLRYADRGTLAPTLPAPTPIPDSVAAFHDAGLADVRVTEEEIAIPVRDPEAFLQGEQAHGARSLFDRFGPDVRQEVEHALLAGLEAMHRRGGIVLRRASFFVEGRVT